jgi:hypothetical protein
MRTKKGINDLIKGIILEGSVNVTNLESTANRIIEALTEENNLFIPDVSKLLIDYTEFIFDDCTDCDKEAIDEFIDQYGN